MKKYRCVAVTDFDGMLRRPGEEISVNPKKAGIFKGNSCWKEIVPPRQTRSPRQTVISNETTGE